MPSKNSKKQFKIEMVALADLKPHPRNYQEHPEDQIEHLIESVLEHGVYKNIVVARDNTILAGHGVAQALSAMDIVEVPVRRLDVGPDDPRALKVMTADNEISHLGVKDDRALSELLKEIKDIDPAGLMGTGFDEQMLANLIFVTRPASEIADFDEAAEWVGMPEYEERGKQFQIVASFLTSEDRQKFVDKFVLGDYLYSRSKLTAWIMWWPKKEQDDLKSVRFEQKAT